MAQLNSLVVTGNSRFISDVGISATLTVGSSAQNKLPTTGIAIHDIRNVDATPLFLNKSVNFYFTNRSTPYGSSLYYSVMHMNGWAGSENYNSWELAGPSHTGDQRTAPLYVRSSSASTWGSWRQLYDSSNKPDGVKDIGNSTNTTFAYSKAGLNYADYTWLAGWNGYELRAINKNQFAQASHTHPINQVTWAGGQNLSPTASANGQEWSIDLTPGSYTGTYFHIYSAKNSKSILQCFTDSNEVVVPSGNLKVTGGKLFATKAINELLTGTGTAAQDKGSGVSPRYFPAKWTMNVGIATPADGDMVTIKIPCAGHDFGVFLSLDNGTTYKPIGVITQSNNRLTTHYPSGRIITLVYDSTAVVDQVFAAAGANSRTNITGAWKVITSYFDGNTYDRNVFGWTNIKAWGTALTAGNIIVGINGVFHHLKEGTAFDITYPILYLNANVGANGTQSNVYDCINFTVTTTQSITLTQFLPVYIKGTLDGTTFTPVSTTPLTQTVPTTADGYTYIELGIASSTTAVYLEHRHKILRYLNGAFGEFNINSNYAVAATKATQDSDGNAINTTYLKKSGGTITGALALNGDLQLKPSSSSSNDSPDIVWYYGNGQEKARLWTADTYSAASGLTYRLYKSDGTSLYNGTIPLTDTKNTAGSTDTSSKIFLIGATSQAANPQTYSDNEVYATSGVLTTKSVQVGGTAATMQYNSTNKCIDFVFA